MVQSYDFFKQFARILNSGQSRSVIINGNIYDLFRSGDDYEPLIPFLLERAKADDIIQVVYELNGPIRFKGADKEKIRTAWIEWKSGFDVNDLTLKDLHRKKSEVERLQHEFDRHMHETIGNPTMALEFLRQLTICSRARLRGSLLIVIEAADMLLPAGNGDVSSLNDRQLRRISIVQDWFSDPEFMTGGDSVCLIAESRGMIHPRVGRLPQVLSVSVPSPSMADRLDYIRYFAQQQQRPIQMWGTDEELASFCAGLSIHAIRQLLAGVAYAGESLTAVHVVNKVEEFIQAQIGEDVVEFKKPKHTLDDVVGATNLKSFLRTELIPRFKATGDKALPGAAVAGPIGSGKTFIFEAVAAELDTPVLVLKNIRSQWFGQTDVIFERLRRVLEALEKVVIFVDEADTQFGGVGAGAHATERRLTGKIQQMMSDPQLRGRIVWLLMTARIHLLSPDIRRPGRVGDLIIPVLDPEGDDRGAFIKWVLSGVKLDEDSDEQKLDDVIEDLHVNILPSEYSAAAFASLRSQVKATEPKTFAEVKAIIHDHIPPAIGLTRKYQRLQALINCTRRSLLPDPETTEADRESWELEIRQLELQGIS